MDRTLLVTIDTEEEFDWSKPVASENRAVTHAAKLPRLQELFDDLGIRPTYVVDHCIATTDESVEVLSGIVNAGNCEIGAHVHPWVNPPFDEEICPRNSYLCNLPLSLQQAKLAELSQSIETAFGVKPTTFKAGRYGLDFRLVPYLQELGYTVDSSVVAFSDFSDDGGPSFDEFEPTPFLLRPPLVPGTNGSPPVLEVPTTLGFTRRPFGWWARLHRMLSRESLRPLHPVGILWHLGLLRKIALSPELSELADMIKLMQVLAKDDSDAVLNVTMHSPSVEAGHTPFVPTAESEERLFATLRGALEFAIRELGAKPMTMSEYEAEFRKREDTPPSRFPEEGRGEGSSQSRKRENA